METSRNRTIVCEFLSRLGDRVEMQMDKETRGWTGEKILDGATGTIAGYYQAINYYGREYFPRGTTPGLYRHHGCILVQWDGSDNVVHANAHALILLNQPDNIYEIRHKDAAYRTWFETPTRLGDLPKLPFYEGDIVELNDPKLIQYWDTQVRIKRIYYNDLNKFCGDGVTPLRCIGIESLDGKRGETNIYPSHIQRVVSRGNHFWQEHAPEQMSFASLTEECGFHMNYHRFEQVKNKISGDYGFTLDEMLQAVKDGEADALMCYDGFFGTEPKNSAYKVIDDFPDLKRRVREASLLGFAKEIAALK